IEDDERARPARLNLGAGGLEAAESADRGGRRRARRGADLGGERGEARRHVLRPAFVEIAPDPVNRVARERGRFVEARVTAPVAGQERQLDAGPARERRQFVDAVAPIVRAAEHASDHEPGARADALEIEVDRERMAERRERGNPKRRPRLPGGLIGARERVEIAVGKREEHHVGRSLAEIDRFDCLVERPDLDARNVHGFKVYQAPSAAATASRSTPRWAITTRRLSRGSAAPQGRSKSRRKRRPTPCTSIRIGLPATSTKPLTRKMSCARVAAMRRSISASGSPTAGIATTKVSKSS